MASMNDQEWKDWTDKFLALGKSKDILPMTNKQVETFISMDFLERDKTAQAGVLDDLKNNFGWNVIQKRADLYKLKYSVPMLVFVCTLCDSPGKAVMWVHALKRLEQKLGREVGMTELAHAFPMGFPIDPALHALWEAQKAIGGAKDNYLDTVAP